MSPASRRSDCQRLLRRRYVPDGAVLGRGIESGGETYRIVGVARDSTYDAFGEPAAPALFFWTGTPRMQGELHLRTREGAEASLAPLSGRSRGSWNRDCRCSGCGRSPIT